ncbi:kinase-like domain-containing protein [Bisporella sp. PMI_857]|nr:kinase-like domain-containing protein [Bisporella sp. PMI_857]
MSTTPSLSSWSICFAPKTYGEETEGRGLEPKKRWLTFVLDSFDRKWHVKLTFQGILQLPQNNTFAKVTKRRKDLENLCLCIDFQAIQLLNDTVTELLLTREHDTHYMESEYSVIDGLWLRIQKDPYQVRYPVYNSCDSCVPARDLSAIKKMKEFSMGVNLVHVDCDEYVYKEVDRPLYIPNDSDALEQELQNLEQMQGTEGIVQLIAVVVSNNPYRTTKAIGDDSLTSLQGILLEYHPNGRLKDVLQSPKPNYPWHQWALEITRTLDALHRNGIAHMDLKPENIVLSRNMHAILIDISGRGGTTRKWLSPEMRSLPEPLSQDIEARKQNDIWALGQILSAMAHATYDSMEYKVLSRISLLAMAEVPPRIPLRNAISILSSSLSALNESEVVPINAVRVKATIGAAT